MESIQHEIKAYLYDNPLRENPNDFMARVVAERSLHVKEICESAANRGGADISADAMQHAIELFFKEMTYQLCDGYSVNTSYFTATPLIKGVFDNPSENFDPKKHAVLFQLSQGETLRKALANVAVQIMGIADNGLAILQVMDVKSGSVNDLLTPNRNLKVNGTKLKIAGNNEANGVYFINLTTGERTKVDALDIATNNPSELIVVIPELPAGQYQLEVCTQYGVSMLLKEPRTTVFDKMLTIS